MTKKRTLTDLLALPPSSFPPTGGATGGDGSFSIPTREGERDWREEIGPLATDATASPRAMFHTKLKSSPVSLYCMPLGSFPRDFGRWTNGVEPPISRAVCFEFNDSGLDSMQPWIWLWLTLARALCP